MEDDTHFCVSEPYKSYNFWILNPCANEAIEAVRGRAAVIAVTAAAAKIQYIGKASKYDKFTFKVRNQHF